MLQALNFDDDDFEVSSLSNNPTSTQRMETTFLSVMEKAATPEKFNGSNIPVDDWIKLFNMTSKANEYTDDQKLGRAMKSLEGNALKFYSHWVEDHPSGKWKDFEPALKKQFPSNLSKLSKRFNVTNRIQQDGEAFSDYAADKLYLLKKATPLATDEDQVTILIEGAHESLFEDLMKRDYKSKDELIEHATKLSEGKSFLKKRRSASSYMAATSTEDTLLAEAVRSLQIQQRNNFQPRGRGFRGRSNSYQGNSFRGNSFRGNSFRGNSFRGNGRNFSQGRPWSRPNSRPGSRPVSPGRNFQSGVRCHGCQRLGHVIANCRSNRTVRFNLNRN